MGSFRMVAMTDPTTETCPTCGIDVVQENWDVLRCGKVAVAKWSAPKGEDVIYLCRKHDKEMHDLLPLRLPFRQELCDGTGGVEKEKSDE